MVTEIDRDELKQKLDHPKKFVLVEALPSHDFHELHLPGAISIPADQIRSQASELLPKEAEIIVYCSGPACHASDDAARELTEMGYSNVIVQSRVELRDAFGKTELRNGGRRAAY